MGTMVDGQWRTDTWIRDNAGHFKREPTTFRNIIEDRPDAPFPTEAGRYHLYVSYACPWAHRTLMVRALMGLEDVIGVSVVHPYMLDDGWTFDTNFKGATGDDLMGLKYLREVYARADNKYSGRVTVPVLWDKKTETIVNNESKEIIRIFSTAFKRLATKKVDLSPVDLRPRIDELIDAIYRPINNGVYRAGFATTQEAYDEAVVELFDALNRWEEHLSENRYLAGEVFTEADICLFPTLLRFDPVYYGHFKCNLKHIYEMPNLWNYTLEIYQMPGIAPVCHLDHIQSHYYYSHPTINPTRIIPKGPNIDFMQPHDRERLPGRIEQASKT